MLRRLADPTDWFNTSGGRLTFTSGAADSTFFATGGVGTASTIPGGTRSDPVTLDLGITQVQGMIGGGVQQAYYGFYWPGGQFSATGMVGTSSADASYLLELVNLVTLATITEHLRAPNYEAGFQGFLAAGEYAIGIDATNPADPPFTIQFATPVNGTAVPEPASVALVALGLAGSCLRRRALGRRLDAGIWLSGRHNGGNREDR